MGAVYLAGIKNVRRFVQLPEQGRKCGVTGEENVLYYRDYEKKKNDIKNAIRVPDTMSEKYFAYGEALGGIAFVKRCADKYFGDGFNTRFPSTARVALMDALSQLAKKDSRYTNVIDLSFEEPEVFSLKNGLCTITDSTASEVFTQLKNHGIDFSSYYAVVLFDGDSMGERLSGKNNKSGCSLSRFHTELSRRLAAFARVSEEAILVQPRGVTVYAGGDDFLGFVNINHLLDVLQELRSCFNQVVDISDFSDTKLTFSAGVVIAHYKTPLSEVLKWAKQMEKEAKSIDSGKDALGIAVLKHSGEIVNSVYKWKCGDTWTTAIMKDTLNFLTADFSGSFLKTFNMEFSPFMDELGRLDPTKINDEMVNSEMKRLAQRAFLDGSGTYKELKEKKLSELLDCLWMLYLNGRSLSNFLSTLNLILFLEREVKQVAEA